MNPLVKIFRRDGFAAVIGLLQSIGMTPAHVEDGLLMIRESDFDGVQMRGTSEDGQLYVVTIRVEGVR